MMHFSNRQEAGRRLAKRLQSYAGQPAVIFGLPRGGVVLGAEIAKALKAPLDLVIARKVGHPLNPEYAVCAVTEKGYLICNQQEAARLDKQWLKQAVTRQQAEAKRRRLLYLANRPPVSAANKLAIITDDGIATGLTVFAAIKEVKARNPAKIVVAIPVIAPDTARVLKSRVDEVVALETPQVFRGAIGDYYDEFEQVGDAQVISLLNY